MTKYYDVTVEVHGSLTLEGVCYPSGVSEEEIESACIKAIEAVLHKMNPYGSVDVELTCNANAVKDVTHEFQD